MSTEPRILIDRPAPRVARLRINRPERSNALTAEAAAELTDALQQAAADADIHVVQLGAVGGRSFCGGYDLSAVTTGVRDEALQDLLSTVRSLPIPTVGLIDGHAVGAGFDLACSCDLRVVRRGVKLGLPAVRIGVAYAATGLRHIVATVPAARRLLLTGEIVLAENLPGFADLLTDTAESDEFATAVAGLTADIASAAPNSVDYMLAMIRLGAAERIPLAEAFRWRDEILDGPDPGVAAAARASKQTPVFTARSVR